LKEAKLTFILLSLCFTLYSQNRNNPFEASKGTWQLPISSVQKIDSMGTDCYSIPAVMPYIFITSNSASVVRSIQSGTVIGAINICDSYLVVVQNGDYYLAYSGLSRILVKKGDSVSVGSELGKLGKNETENRFELALQLMKGADQIDIKPWFNWKEARIHMFSTELTNQPINVTSRLPSFHSPAYLSLIVHRTRSL